MTLSTLIVVAIHALAGWLVIEIFVNTCHRLPRRLYVALHYAVVILAYGAVFSVYFRFFPHAASIFKVTIVAMAWSLFYELVVFRYLYSGERWFLNWVDWILPLFLATSAVYAVGVWLV